MASSDANFFYNNMLAEALVQLLPAHEKPPLREWFAKLVELTSTPEEIEIRNDYMWFMLMMLQCQRIREPFKRSPPKKIEPLRDLVDNKVYQEILIANGDNMKRGDDSGLDGSTTEVGPGGCKAADPSQFFSCQPEPLEGTICYIAAFSDQRSP
ncbi:uncharacterized protein [Euwallacea fornicatus]|uniref:uncharacterized protein isoform X2 n=1 Tax=Euwallacea fornicatus TaxID=995702 RepID=UPI00338F764C